MKTRNLVTVMCLLLGIVVSAGCVSRPLTVQGRVTVKRDGTELPGCSVLVKGTRNGTVTGNDGTYAIRAAKGDILVFSYIDYVEQEKKVNSGRIDVEMEESNDVLEEAIVTGGDLMYDEETMPVAGQSATTCYLPATLHDTEEYRKIAENGFRKVNEAPLSTFSIDVDAASYSNMRRFIDKGELPPADAIRTEELINYFTYAYPAPAGTDPVSITAMPAPVPGIRFTGLYVSL